MPTLQETLEARAIKGRALVPATEVAGTNADPQFPMGMVPRTYAVPERLNAGGWTNTETGLVFIAQPQNIPRTNVIAHEAYHARQVPTGGMPDSPSPKAELARNALAANMRTLQPPADVGGPLWGLSPNRSAEEQIANLRGYEGSLPAGVPITASPIAKQLFSPPPLWGDIGPQGLQDYYFNRSSLPYQGVWEGQSPAPGIMDQALAAARRVLVKGLGMNVPMNKPPKSE